MEDSARYFEPNSQQSRSFNSEEELIASLNRINTYNPPVQTCSTGWSFAGLFKGPASVGYLFLRLSELYPDMEFKGQSLLDWAVAYLDLYDSKTEAEQDVNPDHCGIANQTLTQLALRCVISQDSSLAQKLCSYSSIINSSQVQGSDEWLYGRAGYLYFLRLVLRAFNQQTHPTIHTLLSDTIQSTVKRIISSPQPWVWRDKVFIGAAHGWAGNICQLLLSDPSVAPQLEPILTQLLDYQLPTGNFTVTVPSESDYLVQFCHGGPGVVLALTSIREYFPALQSRIDATIDVARQDIWKRGLLTKEPCLCHGIAGNVLALDDEAQFKHFLSWMTSDSLEKNGWLEHAGQTDRFVSLYGGEAGRAWVWAVAHKNLPKRCIGFNDL